jgi:Zn-finger nucleic acid-binding protein
VRYVACPDCGKIMNRVNFARHSGVVVDVCKAHGTWFDKDELRQILEFIQAGGLDASRQRDLERLKQENELLRQREGHAPLPLDDAVSAARDLLDWLLK